jgi:hypothetical protein
MVVRVLNHVEWRRRTGLVCSKRNRIAGVVAKVEVWIVPVMLTPGRLPPRIVAGVDG